MKDLANKILQRLMLPTSDIPFGRSADINTNWIELNPITRLAISEHIIHTGEEDLTNIICENIYMQSLNKITKSLWHSNHGRKTLTEKWPATYWCKSIYKLGQSKEVLYYFVSCLNGIIIVSAEINEVLSKCPNFIPSIKTDSLHTLILSGTIGETEIWYQPYFNSDLIVNMNFNIRDILVRFDYDIIKDNIVFKLSHHFPDGICTLYSAKVSRY